MQLPRFHYLALTATIVACSATIAYPLAVDKDYTTPFERAALVFTTSGPVVGHASKEFSNVSEYLGIPFAIPPTGDLRFAAPQPYRHKSVIVASNFVRRNALAKKVWRILIPL
jgi:hypothetical protein